MFVHRESIPFGVAFFFSARQCASCIVEALTMVSVVTTNSAGCQEKGPHELHYDAADANSIRSNMCDDSLVEGDWPLISQVRSFNFST